MKILFAGEGGQGVQLAAEILSYAAFLENKRTSLIPNFGVEQRGGVSLAFVKIDEGNYPKFEKADLLAVFCDRAMARVEKYISDKTEVIFGPAVSFKVSSDIAQAVYIKNPKLPSKVWNILILGRIIKMTRVVKEDTVKRALEEKLSGKFKENPELRRINFEALERE